MDDIDKMILNNPMFIQALKNFETMGFIKIKENGIEIINRKGLENYFEDFGKLKN
tara:strand:+ start:908 stop:1072 length:165 start_codon:yes stop_codon:yes gene_type:complete